MPVGLLLCHRIQGDRDGQHEADVLASDKLQGAIIEQILVAHPGLAVVPACKTPADMAALMADHDVVVMPSNSQYWHETFGIVSVEAQHAGCRVVAFDDGGLPETDCGGLVLVEPDNAEALAAGLRLAIEAGPLTGEARRRAGTIYSVEQSVRELVDMLGRPAPVTPASVVESLEQILRLDSAPVGPVPVPPASAPSAP